MNDLPFNVNNLSFDVIKNAINNGYTPKKSDFINNPKLIEYEWFLDLAFVYDPNIIVFFDKERINDNICEDAINRGYIPSISDLVKNPKLYENIIIRNELLKRDKYAPFLLTDDDLKKIILYYLNNNDIESIVKLNIPRLNYKIMLIIDLLNINEDENDMNTQQKYMVYLDKVINGIAHKKYIINKEKFKFNNINLLDSFIKESFLSNVNIDELAEYLFRYVNGDTKRKSFIDIRYIETNLKRLYELYLNNNLKKELSIDFYNTILNDFQNRYESEYKRYLTSTIKDRLSISDKKKEAILKGRKLRKVKEIIKRKEYEKIKVTEEEFLLDLKSLRSYISKIRGIRRSNIVITNDDYSYFESIFIQNGSLSFEEINKRINNKDVCKIIEDKYNKFKLKYIDYITLSDMEKAITSFDKDKIEYNYNNYKFFDKSRFYDNLIDIVINLDKIATSKILDSNCVYSRFASIINFSNITKEFKNRDIINILLSYNKVQEYLVSNKKTNDIGTYNLIYNNFYDFLTLSNSYTKIDELSTYILGNKVLDKIQKSEINDYLNLYLKSYNKKSSSIPSVYGTIGNYTYKSGDFIDIDKLLIGYIDDNSCIKLDNLAGKDTLIRSILDKNSETILIKDKNDNLVARTLMFRLGNVVVMAPITTKYNNRDDILTKEFLDEVADQILKKSMINNDNIDFVFISGEEADILKEYEEYKDPRFNRLFPHADLTEKAYLIGCRNNIDQNNIFKSIDYKCEIKGKYKRLRGQIKDNASDLELTKIKALNVEFEEDELLSKELRKEFKPFNREDYKYVISGDDWYIAVKKNGDIEEVLLPIKDSRAVTEFNEVRKNIDAYIKNKVI